MVMASLGRRSARRADVGRLAARFTRNLRSDTPNASDATLVTVRLSEQVDDIDLTLARVATHQSPARGSTRSASPWQQESS